MSVGRTYYCDGPTCGGREEDPAGGTPLNAYTDTAPPHLPAGFIEVRERGNAGDDIPHHFCGWNCLLQYAAKFPPDEVHPIGPGDLT